MGEISANVGQGRLTGAEAPFVKCEEQLKYENTTLDELFRTALNELVNQHEKLTLAHKRIPVALLSKTRKELAEMGLDFQPWNAMR